MPTVLPARRPRPLPSASSAVPTTEAAFLRARAHWDGRLGDLASAKHNWQLVAIAELGLICLLCAALFYVANESKITPYVVQVDKLGHAVAFAPAAELHEPVERLYRYQLSTFVYDVRAIITDIEAQEVQMTQAFACSSGTAKEFLRTYFRDTYKAAIASNETIAVQVTAVLRLSPKTWRVEWTERHINHGTGASREEHWESALTTAFAPPTTSEEILVNPLGLYVVDINWTKKL